MREVELGAGVGLGRVLVVDRRVGDRLLELAAEARRLDGDVDDAVLVEAEDDLALQRRRRVVEVDDGLLAAADRVVGALDEVVAALCQHLDRHVVGDVAALDELAAEVEVGLARRREADLDLLVAHLHEQLEHPQLALGVHRVDEGLVAVAQVDGAPAWCLLDALRRPRAVRELERDLLVERDVLLERHSRRLLGVDHRVTLSSAFRSVSGRTRETPRRGGPGSGLVAAEKKEAHRSHPFTVCRSLRARPPLGTAARIVRHRPGQGNGVP